MPTQAELTRLAREIVLGCIEDQCQDWMGLGELLEEIANPWAGMAEGMEERLEAELRDIAAFLEGHFKDNPVRDTE